MSDLTFGTTAFTVRRDATPGTVRVAYRGALIVVRDRLDVVSINIESDAPWPVDAQPAANRLQPRPPRRRTRPWREVTRRLDPRDDEDFAVALALAPYTIGGTGITTDRRIVWNVNDTGASCVFYLTEKEHAALLKHLRAADADATSLVPVQAAGPSIRSQRSRTQARHDGRRRHGVRRVRVGAQPHAAAHAPLSGLHH